MLPLHIIIDTYVSNVITITGHTLPHVLHVGTDVKQSIHWRKPVLARPSYLLCRCKCCRLFLFDLDLAPLCYTMYFTPTRTIFPQKVVRIFLRKHLLIKHFDIFSILKNVQITSYQHIIAPVLRCWAPGTAEYKLSLCLWVYLHYWGVLASTKLKVHLQSSLEDHIAGFEREGQKIAVARWKGPGQF